jgi:sporulation protein YabP
METSLPVVLELPFGAYHGFTEKERKWMALDGKNLRVEAPHHLILEDRERLTVSGVEEVERFDENTIVMGTCQGTLVVHGEDLHIEKLSLDGGDLKVEGVIDALSYEEDRGEKLGLLARLFR